VGERKAGFQGNILNEQRRQFSIGMETDQIPTKAGEKKFEGTVNQMEGAEIRKKGGSGEEQSKHPENS